MVIGEDTVTSVRLLFRLDLGEFSPPCEVLEKIITPVLALLIISSEFTCACKPNPIKV